MKTHGCLFCLIYTLKLFWVFLIGDFFFFNSIVTLICKESSIRTAAHFMIAIYGSFQNNNTSRQEQKGFMEFNSELLLLLLLLLNLFIY